MARQFKQYKNLSESLRRSKIPNYGTVTSILLETFLYHKGLIVPESIVSKDLCTLADFNDWFLKLSEYILFEKKEKYSLRFKPTKKLEKYLSKELAQDNEIAGLWKEIENLKESLDGVINIIDPPADEEKREALRKGHYKKTLLKLVKLGENNDIRNRN